MKKVLWMIVLLAIVWGVWYLFRWQILQSLMSNSQAVQSNQQQAAQNPLQNAPTEPYTIGDVDTAFQRVGPDHSIEIGAVPDPKVVWVSCFYSRAKTWGIKWGLGLAEDTSDASVACRQTGPITFKEAIKDKEEIRHESTNLFFKKLRIVRFYDEVSNSLIYLVYSDKLIDWSPKNSISAIALNDVTAWVK